MSREDELWHSVGRNPHCLQAVLNGSRQTELERELPFTRQLTPNSPALPYYRRRNESKTVIHWGQRKLLLSEMEFLNIYGHLSNLVVYAGAAPGTHMNYLIDAFPTHRFVCVDPARFSIRPNARVELRNELFTDEMAREFERARCLFICDIRSADSSNDNADDVEVHVEEDMMAQQQWHKLMRPVKSLLKFRLPWNPGATSYLDGDVYLQAFAPITSTETRLIPFDDCVMKNWDNKRYEDQLFYFNTRARPAVYHHGVKGSGLDHCYDCTSEIVILKQWIMRNEPDLSEAMINERVAEESLRISRSLDTQRTLDSGNADPGLRRAGIIQRQSIEGRPAYRVHTEARGFAVSEAIAVVNKRASSDSPSLPPAKALRTHDSHDVQPSAGLDSHCGKSVRDSAFARSSESRNGEPLHHRVDSAGRTPTDRPDVHRRSPNRQSYPSETSHRDQYEYVHNDRRQQHGNVDESRVLDEHGHRAQNSEEHDYRTQSSARFDVDKYSKMLGVSAASAVSSNYSITSGSTHGSTRGLGFSAAGASSATSRVDGAREKPASQPLRPSNAHVFPEISSFLRWLSVYLYSRIMQGPNRFLDLSLRTVSEVLDAVAYCKPSVYIHGKLGSSVVNGEIFSSTVQEQDDLMQRFPSVLFRGFALDFSGKDGGAELSRLCSSNRTISQIDVVDIGFLSADILTSESSLDPVLDSFHSVCAPLSMLQGRTDCSINDFTRSLPFFASKGWNLLSWSSVERYAIKFRSSRTIVPAAVSEMRQAAGQSVFLMQNGAAAASSP